MRKILKCAYKLRNRCIIKGEDWAHEPTILAIYRKYQTFGSNLIPFDGRDSVSTDDFTSDELDALLDAAQEFERYTDNMPETPWSQWDMGTSIPNEAIQTFFLKKPIPRFKIVTNAKQSMSFTQTGTILPKITNGSGINMEARVVANYMLYIMSDVFHDLTNVKINELLYFALGHYLSKYDKPLSRMK